MQNLLMWNYFTIVQWCWWDNIDRLKNKICNCLWCMWVKLFLCILLHLIFSIILSTRTHITAKFSLTREKYVDSHTIFFELRALSLFSLFWVYVYLLLRCRLRILKNFQLKWIFSIILLYTWYIDRNERNELHCTIQCLFKSFVNIECSEWTRSIFASCFFCRSSRSPVNMWNICKHKILLLKEVSRAFIQMTTNLLICFIDVLCNQHNSYRDDT